MRRPFPLAAAFAVILAAASAVSAADPSIVGTWTGKSRDNFGREFHESVEFTADGTVRLSIRDAGGQLLVQKTGKYTLTGNTLRLSADGNTSEGTIAFQGNDRLTYTLGPISTVYDRVRAAAPVPPVQPVGPAKVGAAGKPLPAGFDSRRPEGGTGELIVVRKVGERSAKKVLVDSLKALSNYFDEKPVLLEKGIVLDKTDVSVQAMFRAKIGGKPVVGAALSAAADGEGVAIILYDAPGKPLSPLFELMAAQGADTRTPEVRWMNAQLPDGSGTLTLPEGWRIESAHKGAVSASGPHGRVDLGLGFPVTTIETDQANARYYAQLGVPYARPSLVADGRDPATAVQQLVPQISAITERGGGARTTLRRIVMNQPVQWQNGKAAVIVGDLEVSTRTEKANVRAVALVAVMPFAGGQFLYYTSLLAIPADKFEAHLPILARIWQSWKVAEWVHTERLLAAVKAQRETGEIYRQAYANYQKSSDRVWRAWSEYNRGVHAVLDTRNNEVGTVQLQWVDDAVNVLNRDAGYERYRKVTPFELDY
jgi:hypothetical protein